MMKNPFHRAVVRRIVAWFRFRPIDEEREGVYHEIELGGIGAGLASSSSAGVNSQRSHGKVIRRYAFSLVEKIPKELRSILKFVFSTEFLTVATAAAHTIVVVVYYTKLCTLVVVFMSATCGFCKAIFDLHGTEEREKKQKEQEKKKEREKMEEQLQQLYQLNAQHGTKMTANEKKMYKELIKDVEDAAAAAEEIRTFITAFWRNRATF